MGNQQILLLFLKALMAAKKSFALYPPGSPMATEWLQRLHGSLQGFLQEGLSFPIRVGPDRFAADGEELVLLDPSLEGFRFDLESRGITEFSIDPAVEAWELAEFLGLLNLPAASLESLTSAADYLRDRRVLHVTVRGPAFARRGPGRVAAAGAPAMPEDDLDRLVAAVLELLEGRLLELAYDRPALAAWFEVLGRTDGLETLPAALRVLSALADGAGDRELRVRTMLEAVLDLPDPIRRPLLADWLVPAAGSDLVAFNLLTQLTEDELASLARLVPEERLLALSAELQEFPWEAGKRQRLVEAITATLQRRGAPTAVLDLPALSHDDPLLVALREEVMAACQSERLLERSIEILLAVVLQVESDEYPGFALDALEEMLGETIARGRLDLALEVLKALGDASILSREWMREHPRRLAVFLKRAASRTHVSLLVGLLRGPQGPELVPLAAQYLRAVGRDGVQEFVALLAEEKSRRTRGRMCQVLAQVGPGVVPSLLPWLEDGRWYVVRNVLAVLGRIGDPAAFLPVVARLTHPHPRVRLEAVRALGVVGGRGAVGPLARVLDDPEFEVRSAAVKVLGSLQDDEAVPVLRELAVRPRPLTAAELALKQEALQALATMGTAAARHAVTELAHRRLWPWQRRERRIRGLAAAALRAAPAPAAPAGWGDDG